MLYAYGVSLVWVDYTPACFFLCNDSNNRMKNKEACVRYKTQRTKRTRFCSECMLTKLVLVVERLRKLNEEQGKVSFRTRLAYFFVRDG